MKNFIYKLSVLLLISVSGVSAMDRDEADAPLGGAVPAPLPGASAACASEDAEAYSGAIAALERAPGSKDEAAKTAAVRGWEAMKEFSGTPGQLCDAAFSLILLDEKDLAKEALTRCIRGAM